MFPIRVKTVQESDLRMLGSLARNIQRVLPVTQADIDAAAALGKGWVVWKVVEVNDPIDNLRGGTQLVIKQNSITPGQNVRRVLIVQGPGGKTVVIGPGPSPLLLPDAIANSLSYVKAYGGTEQRNLPAGYTLYDSLIGDGSAYINLDCILDQDDEIEIDFMKISNVTSCNVFGGRSSATSNNMSVIIAGTGNIVADFNNSDYAPYRVNTSMSQNTMYKVIVNKTGRYVYDASGTLVDSNTTACEDAISVPGCYVFNLAGGGLGSKFVGVVYKCVVKGKRDCVPAYNGTEYGMYDKISGRFFGNANTEGTFSAGNVVVPTPATPIDIISNNGVLKVRHQSGLPLGYTLLDYIESTGTQYIDTGYTMTSDVVEYGIEIYGKPSGASTLFGSELTTGVRYTGNPYTYATGETALWIGSSTQLMSTLFPESQWNTFVVKTTSATAVSLILNGTTNSTAYTGGIQKTLPIYLFGNNRGGVVQLTSNQIKSFYIKDNGVLVRNLVPAKNSSNVVGMYDLVSGQFFTNAGTGDFVAGTAVSDPVEIYTDGTVETINAHGKNLFDQSTATKYRTSWTNNGFWQVMSDSSEAVAYGSYVKPNTTYTLSKKGGSRLIITGYRTKTEPSSEQTTPADYKIKTDTTETVDGSYTFTTPADCTWILFGLRQNNTAFTFPYDVQLEQGSTATEYAPYYDGGTATAEMLLKVGDYQDVQEMLSGTITRNVGILVFDGTENWAPSSSVNGMFYLSNSGATFAIPNTCICSHFSGCSSTITSANMPDMSARCGYVGYEHSVYMKNIAFGLNLATWKQFLADQYAAGTPVIVVYPLATPTTESVTGQTLQVQAGDNVLEITQASLSGLQLEAEYEKEA